MAGNPPRSYAGRGLVLAALICSAIAPTVAADPPADKQNVVVVVSADAGPVLDFAVEEILSFLGGDYDVSRGKPSDAADWTIDLAVDPSMAAYSFSVRCVDETPDGGCSTIRLRGPTPSCVLHAVYTMLERAGICFDILRPIRPERVKLEALSGYSTRLQPAVSNRGVRLHLNFTMDLSSYPLEEAKQYIRNVARLRMNYLTLHSYPGQWYAFTAGTEEQLAGRFFYGERHDIPDDPIVSAAVRNKRVYCIPSIEPYFDRPEAKSRQAIEWLQGVMQEAKRVGLKVNFSFELRKQQLERSLAIAESIIESYPWIDVLELITQEDTHHYVEQLEHNVETVKSLKTRWSDREHLEYAIGYYSTEPRRLKPGFELMRRIVPSDVHSAVIPSHGARAAIYSLKRIPVTGADLRHTMVYSWTEFDGLIYTQQNPVTGVRMLLQHGRRLLGDTPMYGICWNHWRTAENRTALRYAAVATIEGPLDPRRFYRHYAAALGIGNPDEYRMAMQELDDADFFADRNLFSIGFCPMMNWRLRGGLSAYGKFSKEDIGAAVRKFRTALAYLEPARQATVTDEGRSYLEFLANRISTTLLHLQSFEVMSELQPLFEQKEAADFSAKERAQVVRVSSRALDLQKQYMDLHAQMTEDRGCEGTLISYYHGPTVLLRRIRKEFGGYTEELPTEQLTEDEPPIPMSVKD
jgi:hypothetical protein